MNLFKKNTNFIKLFRFYSLVNKTKFRKLTQDGLTRYNYDEFDYQNSSQDFSRISHKTNAEELISRVPVIEVDDTIAICYGVNDFGWGHPVEYITLNTKNVTEPNICKYCGLRYVKKDHEH